MRRSDFFGPVAQPFALYMWPRRATTIPLLSRTVAASVCIRLSSNFQHSRFWAACDWRLTLPCSPMPDRWAPSVGGISPAETTGTGAGAPRHPPGRDAGAGGGRRRPHHGGGESLRVHPFSFRGGDSDAQKHRPPGLRAGKQAITGFLNRVGYSGVTYAAVRPPSTTNVAAFT